MDRLNLSDNIIRLRRERKITQEELADFLCVNRSALSHELGKMEREGLIRFRKNEFTLLSEGKDRSGWS